jgi:hypothetical protein
MRVACLLVALLAVVAAAPIPNFPTSWYDTQYVGVMTMGGQQIALKGATYFQQDSGFARSAFISHTGGTSTFGDYDGKTYGSPASIYYFFVGSSACDCQCPVTLDQQCGDASSLCRYDLMNNLTYANSTTIYGKPVDLFTVDDYLGPIDMAQNAIYVLQNSNQPVYRWQRLTPFGTYQGNITQSYGNWQAGHSADQSWTKIVPGASYCQQCTDGRCDQTKGQTWAGLNLHMMQMAAMKQN